MSLFATKSIETLAAQAAQTGEHSLKRVLGPVNLVTLGIGAIIGTGIFVLTGQVAAANTGPAIVLSMVLAGIASALAGLCYSEFASAVPIAGSAYTYGYATLGELFAWIIGWDLILEYALGAATVAVGWGGHLTSFLHDFVGIDFPAALSAAPGTVVHTAGGDVTAVFNLPAVLITVAVTALIIRGIRESANVNTVIVFVKLAVVVIVILGGAAFVNSANWHPLIPPNTGTFGEYGYSGILTGARDDLLRLHRLRRGIGGRAGGQEPAEGHADRHPRVARRLHDSLHPGVGRDGRPRALQADDGLAGADGRGDSRGRSRRRAAARCCT